MLNNVVLMGRLTRDPELCYTKTSQKPVASFSIAVDRRYSKDRDSETDFVDIVAWQHTAEFVARNFKKGQPICVQGRLQQRSWVDKETKTNRYAIEVIAENIHFAGFKREDGQNTKLHVVDFDPYAEVGMPVAA